MKNTQDRSRQAFHHPRTSLGSAGHWFNVAGLIAPLIIGEFITDPSAKFRAIKLSAIVTAAASEIFWRDHVRRRRRAEQQSMDPQFPR
jgi:hypothetical protein